MEKKPQSRALCVARLRNRVFTAANARAAALVAGLLPACSYVPFAALYCPLRKLRHWHETLPVHRCKVRRSLFSREPRM
ncbi:unnamed protein product [Rangifer tarandus platyrhynchus]|uniref:Uncharacterized protein n=1 Tax=Rangifer tarandus platyrhynchus TaxID=3082113 RepID=A0ABN8XJD3_RANTA|nr:unnamed protein product [Rangifer tarandus platyrhynchus]